MIDEIHATAISRLVNKRLLKEQGGKKGRIWICGFYPLLNSKETKCEDCGKRCFFTENNLDLVSKNNKKICPICALNNYEQPEELRKILERNLEDDKNQM